MHTYYAHACVHTHSHTLPSTHAYLWSTKVISSTFCLPLSDCDCHASADEDKTVGDENGKQNDSEGIIILMKVLQQRNKVFLCDLTMVWNLTSLCCD